jgi:hypothetical protein
MKLIATLTAGLLLGLAACQSNQTTAPGAVSGCNGKACDMSKCSAECKAKCEADAKKDAAAPGAVSDTKSGCCKDKAATTSPGAVSDQKADCHSTGAGCSSTGTGSGCPFANKNTNG